MKTHHVIGLTDNCEKIRLEYQPATVRFDYTKASKVAVTAKTLSELKAVLEMTTARPELKDDDGTDAQLQQ